MSKPLLELLAGILIITAVIAAVIVARWIGWLPDSLIGWVVISLAMVLGGVVYVIRWVLYKEQSWDEAMYLSWGVLIASFFVIGLPYGACKLLLAVLTTEEHYLLCIGVGVVAGLLFFVWAVWIEDKRGIRKLGEAKESSFREE